MLIERNKLDSIVMRYHGIANYGERLIERIRPMSLKDLNDPKAVLEAIAEYDQLGQEVFLKRYGFGKARTFALIHGGRSYDSKAIVGAAHGYQFGTPLSSKQFSGGLATVVPKLEELGFTVVALALDEQTASIPEEVPDSVWEGARRSVTVNRYERSPAARAACIEHHGSACLICGFDFAQTYGADFQGFIHVHHIVPISKIGEQYEVDPINDLIPVCPNCHAALHYGGKEQSPDDIKALLQLPRST